VRLPHEALVAVVRDGELLLVHRSPRGGGYWHLVAGGVEPGETAAQAAARELHEETGLVAEARALGWAYDYPLDEEPERVADFAPGIESVRVEVFLVEAPRGWEPELNREHDGYRWCGSAQAQELLRWPEPRELAARLLD
jgi:8-oxo-dGTP pyrophosphatase MutT (NUDIX family)